VTERDQQDERERDGQGGPEGHLDVEGAQGGEPLKQGLRLPAFLAALPRLPGH